MLSRLPSCSSHFCLEPSLSNTASLRGVILEEISFASLPRTCGLTLIPDASGSHRGTLRVALFGILRIWGVHSPLEYPLPLARSYHPVYPLDEWMLDISCL